MSISKSDPLFPLTNRRLSELAVLAAFGIKQPWSQPSVHRKLHLVANYLMDIFEMAATCAESVCCNHPFLDGNKRAGTACALTFLYLNGYEVDENHDEELADMILDPVKRPIGDVSLFVFSFCCLLKSVPFLPLCRCRYQW